LTTEYYFFKGESLLNKTLSSIPSISPSHSHELRIAVTGQMRTGKDTIAQAISQYLNHAGYSVFPHTFGESLKAVATQLFPEEFKDGKKPRELFQWLGQTMRQRNEDVWINQVNQAISELNELSNDSDITHVAHIITDLRQPNEYEYCKMNNFIIIKVTCDDEVRIKRMQELDDNFKVDDLNHETELHINYFNPDYTLDTTYLDQEQMKETIQGFTKQLLKRQQYRGE